nr:PREDICTED: tigger transposable element-derived protein 3 [Latimeria chalumnae]|eukprot:XP_006004657.1 PREDICTED: tigger transposable element-derived protein 3 [Latimeria chalumnae]
MELQGKKKLHALSLAEKIQVLEMLDESKMSQSEVARRFQVSQPQISRICKNKEKLLAEWCSGTANRERKRRRESKYSSVDEALLCWFHIAKKKMWDITGPMMLQKAKELAEIMGQEFVPSVGWLVRWKRRNNVSFGQRHPPRASSTHEAPPDDLDVHKLPEILKDYLPDNIFSCTEIPLLFRMVPEAQLNGSRKAKECICTLLCVNISGSEKRKPIVVGRHMAPRCLYGVNTEMLPVLYRSSGSGWMTSDIFSEWLMNFDREMGRQHRNVALVLDSYAIHPDIQMCNIRLVFLPPHLTSLFAPLHRDIIQNFKYHYKRRLLGKITAIQSETDSPSQVIANRITVLDAIHLIAAAWEKVKPSLIESCYSEAGFLKEAKESMPEHSSDPPDGMSPAEFVRFVDMEKDFPIDLHGNVLSSGECFYKEEEESDNSDCEDLIDNLPTKADALKALSTLRRWFEYNGSPEKIFESFYRCEGEVERLCCERETGI